MWLTRKNYGTGGCPHRTAKGEEVHIHVVYDLFEEEGDLHIQDLTASIAHLRQFYVLGNINYLCTKKQRDRQTDAQLYTRTVLDTGKHSSPCACPPTTSTPSATSIWTSLL
jgi:hypothetical protein